MATPTCLYASRPCATPRSLKTNGELHRLCDEHRSTANAVQRRCHSRQRPGSDANGDSNKTKPRASPVAQDTQRTRHQRRRWERRETEMDVHGSSYVDMLSAVSFALEEDQHAASASHTPGVDWYCPRRASARIASVAIDSETPSQWTTQRHWMPVGQPTITAMTSISL